ncbi:MAG: hypothetical protein Q3993_03010 [Filifactor alocis]|nr:hypothetical protein [Filifactor alocis]
MKLSKREKMLLSVTFVIALVTGYYFFVFEKLEAKITSLQQELEQVQTQYDTQELVLRQAAQLGSQMDELKKEIYPIAKRYYGKTEQEEFIAEIDKINQKSGMDIQKINFSEDALVYLREPDRDESAQEQPAKTEGGTPSDGSVQTNTAEQPVPEPQDPQNVQGAQDASSKPETGADQEMNLQLIPEEEGSEAQGEEKEIIGYSQNIKLMQTEIEFFSTYKQMLKWLHAVDNNPKNIISGKLEMERKDNEVRHNDKNPILKGKVRLSFYQVKDVDKYDVPMVTFLTQKPIPKSRRENPFQSYRWAWKVVGGDSSSGTRGYPEYGSSSNSPLPPAPVNPLEPNGNQNNPLNVFLKKKDLYDFEDETIRIKKNVDSITAMGEIERGNVAKGKFAGKVSYSFSGESAKEKILIDLSEKNLTLDKKMETVTFSVFAEEELLNEVGLIISDSKDQEYQIVMANEISWRGWRELSYDFHGIENYPIKIKGIYVAYGEKKGTKSGRLVFDDINVGYLDVK